MSEILEGVRERADDGVVGHVNDLEARQVANLFRNRSVKVVYSYRVKRSGLAERTFRFHISV